MGISIISSSPPIWTYKFADMIPFTSWVMACTITESASLEILFSISVTNDGGFLYSPLTADKKPLFKESVSFDPLLDMDAPNPPTNL